MKNTVLTIAFRGRSTEGILRDAGAAGKVIIVAEGDDQMRQDGDVTPEDALDLVHDVLDDGTQGLAASLTYGKDFERPGIRVIANGGRTGPAIWLIARVVHAACFAGTVADVSIEDVQPDGATILYRKVYG